MPPRRKKEGAPPAAADVAAASDGADVAALLEREGLVQGAKVEARGLSSAAGRALNGAVGVLTGREGKEGRLLVAFPAPHGEKAVRAANLRACGGWAPTPGAAVAAAGLRGAAALNGRRGVVLRAQGDDRFVVDFGGDVGEKALRPQHLEP
eukprot:gene41491-6621_t